MLGLNASMADAIVAKKVNGLEESLGPDEHLRFGQVLAAHDVVEGIARIEVLLHQPDMRLLGGKDVVSSDHVRVLVGCGQECG